MIKLIKFLIKNEGMSILGKKHLKCKKLQLENINAYSLNAKYHKMNLKKGLEIF